MTELFDAEALRSLDQRTVFVRTVAGPTMVLGSTQDASILDAEAMARHGVEQIRRRSGGGAVLLQPQRAVWIDTWVPRADPLWSDDVTRSSAWVGSWWAESLPIADLEVHKGPAIASRWSDRICFAGVTAGEVLRNGRKVVGIAQWRSREGALSHSLAYLGIEWRLMTELLDLGTEGEEAARELEASTASLADLVSMESAEITSTLLERLPDPYSWEVSRPIG
jgi:lipoate---protein ligase